MNKEFYLEIENRMKNKGICRYEIKRIDEGVCSIRRIEYKVVSQMVLPNKTKDSFYKDGIEVQKESVVSAEKILGVYAKKNKKQILKDNRIKSIETIFYIEKWQQKNSKDQTEEKLMKWER